MIIENVDGKLIRVNKDLIQAVTLYTETYYKSNGEHQAYCVYVGSHPILVTENEQKKILSILNW